MDIKIQIEIQFGWIEISRHNQKRNRFILFFQTVFANRKLSNNRRMFYFLKM